MAGYSIDNPINVFTPWGWGKDLTDIIFGNVSSSHKTFEDYIAVVNRDIHYQCVIFARYDGFLLVIDCCDAARWEIDNIDEPHLYLKLQYDPTFKYSNNVFPFTYVVNSPKTFFAALSDMRRTYADTPKTEEAYGRWIAVSLARYRISEQMRKIGIMNGGQFCICATGYDDHEKNGLLDPVMPRCRMPWDEYFKNMCRARSCIDAMGFGDMTHRLIESFGIGIPVIRPKLTTLTYEPIEAGKHYLDCGTYGEKLAECIEQMRDDRIRDGLISNGFEWYVRNSSEHALKLLIEKILNDNMDKVLNFRKGGTTHIGQKYFKYASKTYENFNVDKSKYDNTGYNGISPDMVRFIAEQKPSVIIELGSYKGNSAIAMAKTMRQNNVPGIIICVDTWLGSIEHINDLTYVNGRPELFNIFLNNVMSDNVQDIIIPFPQTSNIAFEYLRNIGVMADMIYVDASHDYKSVREDVTNYWSLVRNGGMLCGDDINWSGVKQAVDEVFGDRYVSAPPFWSIVKN